MGDVILDGTMTIAPWLKADETRHGAELPIYLCQYVTIGKGVSKPLDVDRGIENQQRCSDYRPVGCANSFISMISWVKQLRR